MDTHFIRIWTREHAACLALERLSYSVKKKKEKSFAHLWSPYIDFLENYY